MNKKERIAMIQENLEENELAYREGKKLKKLYLSCKRDGKKRITEIRREK